jgi:hypothetical protein
MEGYWQSKTKILGGKSFPLILCLPHPYVDWTAMESVYGAVDFGE